jgi:hypothetical protein
MPRALMTAGKATDVRDMSIRTSAALASAWKPNTHCALCRSKPGCELSGGVRLVAEAGNIDAAATVGRRMEIRQRLVWADCVLVL